jgi:hypothetical protein
MSVGSRRCSTPSTSLFLIIRVWHSSSLFNGKTTLGLFFQLLVGSKICTLNVLVVGPMLMHESNTGELFDLLISPCHRCSALCFARNPTVHCYRLRQSELEHVFALPNDPSHHSATSLCFQFSFISSPLHLTRLAAFEMAILQLTCVLMRLQSMSMAFAMACAGPGA